VAKPGRPKIELDRELITKLARIQCSNPEIAAIMGCHPDTLRDNYSTELDKGRQMGKTSLRRKQWKVAMGGNVAMLIWLGKQYLDQSEKVKEAQEDPDRPLEERSDEELTQLLDAKRKGDAQ